MGIEKRVIGNAEVYLGDCREVMRSMHSESVDHVITDVPYDSRTHKMAKTNKGKGHGTTLIDFAAIDDRAFIVLMSEFLRVARRWVVTTCDINHAPLSYGWPEFVRQGVWVKDNPMPQISADRPGQGFEAVLCLHREGKKEWNGGGKAGVWRFPVQQNSEYPTQKPQRLLDQLVDDFTRPGETIFDPCMGSGTTGVSAVSMGRSFVGCEVRPEAFEIACQRLAAAQQQADLFAAS